MAINLANVSTVKYVHVSSHQCVLKCNSMCIH